MPTVKNILARKGSQVWSVGPQVQVFDALKLMAEKNVGALLVLKKGKLAGIFSERDYARKVVLKGKSSRKLSVSEIMTSDVKSIQLAGTIEECMALMTSEHIRHLPVLEKGKVVGVISIGDVVKEIISEQQFVIEQLENYIKAA